MSLTRNLFCFPKKKTLKDLEKVLKAETAEQFNRLKDNSISSNDSTPSLIHATIVSHTHSLRDYRRKRSVTSLRPQNVASVFPQHTKSSLKSVQTYSVCTAAFQWIYQLTNICSTSNH